MVITYKEKAHGEQQPSNLEFEEIVSFSKL
jgi:hypothetical protein